MKSPTILSLLAIAAGIIAISAAQESNTLQNPAPTQGSTEIAEKVRLMQALPGFFTLYWDGKKGQMWLEIPKFDQDFIYFTSLPAGLGSNDVGLDRGQIGGGRRLVRFTRHGNKVLLVQQNLAFRALSDDAFERRSIADSFASSVLAGFAVEAEENGRVLVNATDFFLRDAHDVIGTLKRTRQGSFSLDEKRSAFFLPRTKSFPRNTEVEVTLTFSSADPGEFVRDVAPDPKSITLRERHSLVQLPEPGYVPRPFDPRAGYFPVSFADYSAPISQPLVQRFITRHRLEKQDLSAARSQPVKPIVYYLDPGTPEPVRSALLEGGRWWNEAFEAAGFINAFRVELLPPDADMQDVRYNTIQWVHRATRGWSYGSTVVDPRTGEIIKGHVTLGSLRVRQDYLIAEGFLAPYEEGKPASPEMERMALARLRQLSAHEIGHTLGLAHNYIASTADRASVMDYPHPNLKLRPDGTIDLSDAYATGVGAWDKVAIAAGYSQFDAGNDQASAIDQILNEARQRGLYFLTDQDARPQGSAHSMAHLWDNGTNSIAELNRMLEIRAAALARFGPAVLKPGQPLALMEEALVPVYLSHRYQLEAVAKAIGGQNYTLALRGDGQAPLAPVPGSEQLRALDALLAALSPDSLRISDSLLAQLPPRPSGFAATRELFKRRTGSTFDALAPAEAAAVLTFELMFHPERANRLIQQHARNSQLPGLDHVIERMLNQTWKRAADASGYEAEIQRVVAYVGLRQLFRLGANDNAGPQAQAITSQHLAELRDWLTNASTPHTPPAQQAFYAHGRRMIERFFEVPNDFAPPETLTIPPGQPIGSDLDCGD